MPQAKASGIGAESLPKPAPKPTVGDRLAQVLRAGDADNRQLRWFGLVMLAFALLFPWFAGPFYMRLAIEALLLGAVALSVDILLGYAGLLSLGQAAYLGVGAYLTAILATNTSHSMVQRRKSLSQSHKSTALS